MRKDVIAAAVLAALSLGAVSAASAEGFYVGAGVGEASIEDDELDFDDGDTAFKVFGGYQFGENFAVELAYLDGGTAEEQVFGSPLEAETTAITAAVHGILPLGEMVELFAKVGFASYDLELSYEGESADDSEEELMYGAGVALNLGERFQIRGEYEMIDVSDGSADILSLSAIFKFGG